MPFKSDLGRTADHDQEQAQLKTYEDKRTWPICTNRKLFWWISLLLACGHTHKIAAIGDQSRNGVIMLKLTNGGDTATQQDAFEDARARSKSSYFISQSGSEIDSFVRGSEKIREQRRRAHTVQFSSSLYTCRVPHCLFGSEESPHFLWTLPTGKSKENLSGARLFTC